LEPSFRSRLLEELGEWLPEDALSSLSSAPDAEPLCFADRAVHRLLSLGLEAKGAVSAAHAVLELPGLVDTEAARKAMFALEKLARAHAAPELLVRAAHGVCACALSLTLTEARGSDVAERSRGQLVSAIVRLATTGVRSGVPPAAAVEALALPAP
jgi:hypothetical protein